MYNIYFDNDNSKIYISNGFSGICLRLEEISVETLESMYKTIEKVLIKKGGNYAIK